MKTLIIREGTWDWCCYLLFAVLIGASIYFITRASQSLKLFRQRKKEIIGDLAVGYRERLRMHSYVSAIGVFWFVMVIASFYLIWLVYRDTLGGFTRVQISDGKAKFFYMWPIPPKEIARTDIGFIDRAKSGKNAEVIIIMTSTGTFRSVSDFPEQIDADCRELREDLAIDGR